ADLFASGEVIMAQSWEPVAAWAGDKGVTLKWNVPKEGTWTLVDCLALITDAPHEDAAYLLMNHGLSGEAQAHVANVNTTGVTVETAGRCSMSARAACIPTTIFRRFSKAPAADRSRSGRWIRRATW